LIDDFFLFFLELLEITNKIDLPLYDFVTGNDIDIDQNSFDTQKHSKTEQLLMEFDSIYDAVELDHLTPPQTPPEQKFLSGFDDSQQFVQNIPSNEQEQQQFIFDFQSQQEAQQEQYIYLQNDVSSSTQDISIVYENSNHSMTSSEDYGSTEIIIDPEPIISSPADLQRELEVVDEIIQAHSRSQSDYDDDNCTTFTTSSWAASPRSDYSVSSFSQDDEPVKKSSTLRGVTKKRTRPYGRNPDEKKSRKKEQNKNAATRYRQKKKEEVHVILSEEQVLAEKNKKLFTAFKDTQREVKYLKSLLRELFQARGFIQ
jgi:cyclic AMP-dependent transcription factor ATF-4